MGTKIEITDKEKKLTRQMDIIGMDILSKKIVIVGAGAIGSWTAFQLAKMGFEDITVYDHDTIELENMNAQLYSEKQVGMPKVDALASIIEENTGLVIKTVNGKWERNNIISADVVLACADSMQVRRDLFDTCLTEVFLDPRMGAEIMVLLNLNPNLKSSIDLFDSMYFTDDQAVKTPCTSKATVYCASMLSGLVVQGVKCRLLNLPYVPQLSIDLPSSFYNICLPVGEKKEEAPSMTEGTVSVGEV